MARTPIRVMPDAFRGGLHDTMSTYATAVWLPVLGPAAWAAWRTLAHGIRRHPTGWSTSTEQLAAMLGLGSTAGNQCAIARALRRLERFAVTRRLGDDMLIVRCRLPNVTTEQLARLHPDVQIAHRQLSLLRDAMAT